MIVRWIGAFGKAPSLPQAFDWELTSSQREVCAEPCGRGACDSRVSHAHVGLVVARHAVRRIAKGDVWSEPDSQGYLRPSRRPNDTHGEAFCRPVYRAIIYRGRISKAAYRAVMDAARKYQLPVLRILPDGQTKEVYRP
jgi:hypothetical protein